MLYFYLYSTTFYWFSFQYWINSLLYVLPTSLENFHFDEYGVIIKQYMFGHVDPENQCNHGMPQSDARS